MKTAILALLALVVLAACSQPQGPTGPPVTAGGQQESSCVCIAEYAPVCGVDGKTYSNSCYADCAHVTYKQGECQ